MSSVSESSDDLDEEIRGDEFGPAIDDNALAAAARASRMPFDRPTEHELTFFPELWESKAAVEVYLLIRNTTLATWHCNQWKECTALDVRNNVFPPFNSDLDLIQNIVHFLTRYGIINFGRYTRSTKINRFLIRDERSVIVIGAGAAGIAAATQLISFGFDVTILEARERIGGRCCNIITKSGQLMETGGDTLRQLSDSPLLSLLHQVNLEEHGVFDNALLYFNGKPVPEVKTSLYFAHYFATRQALNWQAHEKEHRDPDDQSRYISRQQAYENMFSLIERGTYMQYYNYCQDLETVALSRERNAKRMKELRDTAFKAEAKLRELEDQDGTDADPLLRRSLKKDIAMCIQKFDEVTNAFEADNDKLLNLEKYKAPKQVMQPIEDFCLFNFLLGFEEYIFGAPLEQVQFSCDAEQNKNHGVAVRLTRGLATLLTQIAEKRKLDIRLRHRILDIDYSGNDRVKLKVKKFDADGNEEIREMQAAFVVSTIPIGVLKKTIMKDERAPTFSPPLPEEKVEAIKCMGSGLVNKCIMEFERAFWAQGQRFQFVTVSPNVKTRGSMHLWSAVPGSKVITTYIVGDIASTNLPDDVIIQDAMANLQKVFGNQCPKAPITAHITRWQDDEFAFGSGSYMSLRTEPHHFDALMKPLETADAKPRVYFAGEHTCSSYTSTVQGAWMSGARAAADLANSHIGIGFVDVSGSVDSVGGGGDLDEIIQVDRDGEATPPRKEQEEEEELGIPEIPEIPDEEEPSENVETNGGSKVQEV